MLACAGCLTTSETRFQDLESSLTMSQLPWEVALSRYRGLYQIIKLLRSLVC